MSYNRSGDVTELRSRSLRGHINVTHDFHLKRKSVLKRRVFIYLGKWKTLIGKVVDNEVIAEFARVITHEEKRVYSGH